MVCLRFHADIVTFLKLPLAWADDCLEPTTIRKYLQPSDETIGKKSFASEYVPALDKQFNVLYNYVN